MENEPTTGGNASTGTSQTSEGGGSSSGSSSEGASRSQGSGGRQSGDRTSGSQGGGVSQSGGGQGGGQGGGGNRRRRRGKRGGQRHRSGGGQGGGGSQGGGDKDAAVSAEASPSKSQTEDGAKAEAPAEGATDKAQGGGQPRQRQRSRSGSPRQPRSGSGGGSGRSQSSGGKDEEGDSQEKQPSADSAAADQSAESKEGDKPQGAPRKRRRRRGKGGSKQGSSSNGGSAAENGDANGETKTEDRKQLSSAQLAAAGATRLAARKLREEQRKQRGKGRRPRRLTDAEAQKLKGAPKTMLIHEHEERTQIAILEEDQLIEHYVSRRGQRGTMVGNVYMGKVQNVIVGMEAAFVDFGRGRNGILYANEITYTDEDFEGEIPRIEKALKPGQRILVQVTKDPIGTKGARLTTQVALAGRYLVLAPDQQAAGVSRRLSDRERMRLRKILKELAPPEEHGVIIRTAADGASAEAIAADLSTLLKQWNEISQKSKGAKAPAALYEEPELIMRVVRDIFADDFEAVICDTRSVYEEITSYLKDAAPDLLEKVSLHEGRLPLFEERRVSEQLHKSLERKVWLPSGGSLIFERTEAMTVVDVNTGKFTGKGTNLEETVFKNNCEAAEEIARQLRLRDIGGIIIIDFIDMIDPKNQREVLKTLKGALSKDKTKSQVFEVSNLGLVEMTRKRVSEGLVEAFSDTCPNCDGRGIIVNNSMD